MKVILKNTKLVFEKYVHVDFTDNDVVNSALLELYVNDNHDMSEVKAINIVNCAEITGTGTYRFGINFYDENGLDLGYDGVFVGNQPDSKRKNKAVMTFSHGYFVIDANAIVSEGEITERLSIESWSNYTDLNNSPKIKEYLSNI